MTKYEFCWSVSPSRNRDWQHTQVIDGLEVEISGDRILIRAESVDSSEDDSRNRAESVVADLVRAMTFHEGLQLTCELSHIKTVPSNGPAHLAVDAKGGMEMNDNATYTMFGYIKCDAVIVKSSGQVDIQSILLDCARLRGNQSFQRMLGFIAEFRVDPEKKLAPLYNILEIVEAEFRSEKGAAQALGVSRKAMKKVKRITNDPTIRTARHPGKNAQTLRDTTPAELSECERTAEEIIRAYAKQIRN
jgi:hypothetical protein